jgi:hypothetical protein
MPFTPQQRQIIKESSELYRHEIENINDLIEKESDNDRCDQLYLLRAIATIEHGNRIGLFTNEEGSEEYFEAMAKEVNLYFPHKNDSELFDDISVLEEYVKKSFFDNPAKEKDILVKMLGISL